MGRKQSLPEEAEIPAPLMWVVRQTHDGDQNVYLYNAPLPGDWTYWDAKARNPSPLGRDFWMIPRGNDVVAVGSCPYPRGNYAPGPAPEPTPTPQLPTVAVTASESGERIRNMAGMNWLHDPEKELSIPSLRLWLLTGWLPGSRAIFPDLEADPDDPANYDWTSVDEKLDACIEHGAEPYLMLCLSPAEVAKVTNGQLPAQYLVDRQETIARSLARIAYHILSDDPKWQGRGMSGPAEIWNEPIAATYWPNTTVWSEPLDSWKCLTVIIEKTFNNIKELVPAAKVGGWAGCPWPNSTQDNIILNLLAAHGVELDFYSWHDYRMPENMWSRGALRENIEATAQALSGAGTPGIPQHITEWNGFCWCITPEGDCDPECKTGSEVNDWYRSVEGAALTAVRLMQYHDFPQVEYVHRWNGGPPYLSSASDPFGLWDPTGSFRYPAFYAVRMFSRKLAGTGRLPLACEEPLVAMAGIGDDSLNVLISSGPAGPFLYRLLVSDIPWPDYIYCLTAITDNGGVGGVEPVLSGTGNGELSLIAPGPGPFVHLLEIKGDLE